jgi:hypothetical protein
MLDVTVDWINNFTTWIQWQPNFNSGFVIIKKFCFGKREPFFMFLPTLSLPAPTHTSTVREIKYSYVCVTTVINSRDMTLHRDVNYLSFHFIKHILY